MSLGAETASRRWDMTILDAAKKFSVCHREADIFRASLSLWRMRVIGRASVFDCVYNCAGADMQGSNGPGPPPQSNGTRRRAAAGWTSPGANDCGASPWPDRPPAAARRAAVLVALGGGQARVLSCPCTTL